jgi:hypothetical protein
LSRAYVIVQGMIDCHASAVTAFILFITGKVSTKASAANRHAGPKGLIAFASHRPRSAVVPVFEPNGQRWRLAENLDLQAPSQALAGRCFKKAIHGSAIKY